MPEVPQAAVDAAVAAYAREGYCDGRPIDGDERVIRAALEAAAPLLAEAWGVGIRREVPGMEGLAADNAYRSRQAGDRDARHARRALEVLGDQCSQRMRLVAEARIASPEASWSEIARKLGMTKDQATGLFRRLVHRAPVYYALRNDEAYAAYYR